MLDTRLAKDAIQLAKNLPFPVMVRLAEAIRNCDLRQWSVVRGQIVSTISQPSYRAQATGFLDHWRKQALDVLPESISLALLTAAHSEKEAGTNRIELAWTGPEVGLIPLRQTEQGVFRAFDEAQDGLL